MFLLIGVEEGACRQAHPPTPTPTLPWLPPRHTQYGLPLHSCIPREGTSDRVSVLYIPKFTKFTYDTETL